jgi:S1-C subfamily serine protease
MMIGCDYLVASNIERVRDGWRFRARAYRIWSREYLGEVSLPVKGLDELEARISATIASSCSLILDREVPVRNAPGSGPSAFPGNDVVKPSGVEDPSGDGTAGAQGGAVTKVEERAQEKARYEDAELPGRGTGFALSPRIAITNWHVVGASARMRIVDGSGFEWGASVLGRDESLDLAVLYIDDGLPTFKSWLVLTRAALGEFAQSGQKVFVLGYPLPDNFGSDEITVTDGIVNARSGLQGDSTSFRMSVPIQPGNSGGPVFSEQGYVVGVVCATLKSKPLFDKRGVVVQNVNFAIKSNMLLEAFPWLLERIPGSEVHDSYFNHMAAGMSESATPEGALRGEGKRMGADEIVRMFSPAVLKILPPR